MIVLSKLHVDVVRSQGQKLAIRNAMAECVQKVTETEVRESQT